MAALLFTGQAAVAANAHAGTQWQAVIPDYDTFPARLIAVDKDRQQLFVYEKQSPLQLLRTFTCTTGQAKGDKIFEGDLRTPEGIYFVERRIDSGLDFIKYGKEAYTLNYPNPVDRLRQKSGYGIWIHGRGEPLVPLQTEGCVAMNNGDMAMLGKILVPGTPVALASSVLPKHDAPSVPQVAKAAQLEKKVREWAAAWSGRSNTMFDFYDAESYSLATESFSAFKAQKQRLFKSLAWIKTSVRDIQVLEGPGYWVTWFYQEYEAPNLSTRGVRRLYWTEDAKGEMRIVGMEWAPKMQPVLLASADSSHLILRAADADTGQGRTMLAAADDTRAAEEAKAQARVEAAAKAEADARAKAEADAEAKAVAEAEAKARAAEEAKAQAEARAREEEELKARLLAEVQAKTQAEAEVKARAEAEEAYAKAQAEAVAQARAEEAARAQAIAEAEARAKAEEAARVKAEAEARAKASAEADAERERRLAEARTLAEAKAARTQEAVQLQTPELQKQAEKEKLVQEASVMVESWRKAWEQGSVTEYAAFYSKDAAQGGRHGAEAIRKHKQKIWKGKASPAKVELSGIRIIVDSDSILVDMHQSYTNQGGEGDVGIKSLVLKRLGKDLLITREDWKPLEE